jgi:DNA repair photolyase
MFAPVIPILNDSEMEQVFEAASYAGAHFAGYVIVRLPHEDQGLV